MPFVGEPKRGEWIEEKNKRALQKNVLGWLAGMHEHGKEDWCKKMEALKLVKTLQIPSKGWVKLDLEGHDTLYFNEIGDNWLMSRAIRKAGENTLRQNKPVRLKENFFLNFRDMEQYPFNESGNFERFACNQWRPRKNRNWETVDGGPNALYRKVLRWLADKHKFGKRDWCQSLVDLRSEFKFAKTGVGKDWMEIFQIESDSFYARRNIGNDKKPFLLAEACRITLHQDKPVKPRVDLFVEMMADPRK